MSLKLIGKKITALLPLAGFVFLQPFLDGNQLWFDLGTAPFITLGIFLYFYLQGSRRYFWLGLFLSLACLIKQQTGIAVALVLLTLLVTKKWRETMLTILGGLLPLSLVLIYQLTNNTFSDYFFWTTLVPLVWYPKFPGYTHFPSHIEIVETLLTFGPAIFWTPIHWKRINFETKIVFLIFLGLFLPAFPRFEFFRFQEALAAYIVLVVCLFDKKIIRFTSFLGMVLVILVLLTRSNLTYSVRFYGDFKMANVISQYAVPNEKVYLLGPDSLNYVLANRLPSKPWIDNYVWYLEIPGLQQKLISGFENENVKTIFWQLPQPGNWYDIGTYQPKQVVQYIKSNYKLVTNLDGGVQVWQKD